MSTAYAAADLLNALPVNALVAFGVLTRVGAMMMTAPAFGDHTLSPRIRLAVAIAVTAAIAPAVAGNFPALAAEPAPLDIAALIVGEALAGAFMGLTARFLAAALNVAGQTIALQMGLSLAQAFDPSQETQGAIIGGFLAVLGTTMIFATNAHHLMLFALVDSYRVFSPAAPLMIGDLADALSQTLSHAFSLGVRLAAPFIVFGLVFNLGAGILNRVMPQAQVFFMLMPANLILGLMLLMMTTGLIMTGFLAAFGDGVLAPLR